MRDAPTAELALKRVSRTTVQSRIERLEARGVITDYGVRLAPDYEKKGLVRARGVLLLRLCADRHPETLRQGGPGSEGKTGGARFAFSRRRNRTMIVVVESPSISDLGHASGRDRRDGG